MSKPSKYRMHSQQSIIGARSCGPTMGARTIDAKDPRRAVALTKPAMKRALDTATDEHEAKHRAFLTSVHAHRIQVPRFNRRLLALGGLGADLSPNDYMDKVVAELKRQLTVGSVKVGLNPDAVAKFLLLGPAALLFDESAQDAAARRLVQDQGANIKKLDTVLRAQVFTGKSPTGLPYTLKDWSKYALVIGDAIQFGTKASWDSSLIALAPSSVVLAAKKTADDVVVLGKKAAPFVGGAIFLYAAGAIVGSALLSKILSGPKIKLAGTKKR